MEDFSIKINDTKWSVKFVDSIEVIQTETNKNTLCVKDVGVEEYAEVCKDSPLGICDNDNKVIVVATDNNEIRTTLIHEVIHAVSHEDNIAISEDVVEDIAVYVNLALQKCGLKFAQIAGEDMEQFDEG